MKTASKILIGLFAFMLVSVLAFSISLRASLTDEHDLANKLPQTVYTQSDFNTISAKGKHVSVEVKQGREFQVVAIGLEEELKEQVFVVQKDSALELSVKSDSLFTRRVHFVVTMPDLVAVEVVDDAMLNLNKMHLDSVSVVVKNWGRVDGNENVIKWLGLENQNARVQIDYSDISQADILLKGEGRTSISLERVKGKVMDKSRLDLYKETKSMNLEVAENAYVRKYD
ncbi:DUF2807 domain-containing protein [Flammeovirgaceae bacterium SG7u.111]|nr:DUF2807 domain-containing protein [Flammeovirgaceae bacterium SG7u.132]WPO38292.1 DUF2807 domain-containing protein [Flammeovirgaceae bacterium SG7u.111]